MPLSPDQASQLLQSGQISQGTYDQIMSSQQPTAAQPAASPVQDAVAAHVSPVDTQSAPPSPVQPQSAPEPSMLDKIVQAAPEAAKKTLDAITPSADKVDVLKNAAAGLMNPPSDMQNAAPASPTGSAPDQKVAPSALISNQTQTAPNPTAAAQQSMKDIANDTLQAQTHQEAATLALGKAAQQQAAAEYNAKVQGDKVLTDLQNQHLDNEKKQQEIINGKVSDMESAAKDYSNMPPLDQNRYWSKASTGDKLLAGISVILGGIAQGKGEVKTNPGIDYVNNAIEKDLDSQKEMISRKKEAFNMQDSLLGRMYTRYGNWEQAELAAKNAALEGVQRKVDIASSQYNSPIIQAKANLAIKDIENQKQANKLKFQELAQQTLNSPLAVGAGAEIPADPAIMARLPKEAKESAVRLPNGNFGIATSPKAAEELNTYMNETQSLNDGINQLKKYATLGSKFSPQDRAEAETLRASLIENANKAAIGGRISAVTKTVFDQVLRDPTALFSKPGSTLSSYNILQNTLNNETQNRMVQAGVSKRKVNFTPSK